MKWCFCLVLFYSHCVFSQEITPSVLTCHGDYWDYEITERAIPFRGGVIKIAKETILLSGFAGITSNESKQYHIVNTTDSFIEFVFLHDQNFRGSLSRYTGEINLNQFKLGSTTKVNKIIFGKCALNERLF
jgi:hypothetical protein